MKLNKHLGKFKRTWTKDNSLESINDQDDCIYLKFETYNPLVHRCSREILILEQWPLHLAGIKGVYFFELFKYMIKVQEHNQRAKILGMRMSDGSRISPDVNTPVLLPLIKKHLIKRYNKKLPKVMPVKDRMNSLKSYSDFIDLCLQKTLSLRDIKISLVIQKKIGYKYYENTIYGGRVYDHRY